MVELSEQLGVTDVSWHQPISHPHVSLTEIKTAHSLNDHNKTASRRAIPVATDY